MREAEEEAVTLCDISDCEMQTTKRLSAATSPYCASWFIGNYCEACYAKVEQAMREICEQEEAYQARANQEGGRVYYLPRETSSVGELQGQRVGGRVRQDERESEKGEVQAENSQIVIVALLPRN